MFIYFSAFSYGYLKNLYYTCNRFDYNHSMKKLLFVFFAFVTCGGSFVHAQATGTVCAGTTVLLTHTATGLTSVSQSITPTTGVIGSAVQSGSIVTYTVMPLVSAVYTITATGLNGASTQTTMSSDYSITVNPQPTVNPTYTNATCTNSNNAFCLGLTFNPPTPVPNYTVVWTAIDGNSAPGFTATLDANLICGTNSPAGVYLYTVVAEGGCGIAGSVSISPQPSPAVFTVSPIGTNVYSITCAQPSINVSVTNPTLTYVWQNAGFGTSTSTTVEIDDTFLGTWSVTGTTPGGGCTATKVFSVVLAKQSPISAVTPTNQQLTCFGNSFLQTVTLTAVNPTNNVVHYVINDLGQVSPFTGSLAIFQPSATTSSYTYVLVNAATGCSAIAKPFYVTTSANAPTFAVTSTGTLSGHGNFTVGCTPNNHLSVINISNPNTNPTPGGGLQFGFIQPGSTNTVPAFGSAQSTVVSTPGTWTVVVKSTSDNCETRQQVVIIQNTVTPNISAIVPTRILSCFTPSTVLMAETTNTAVGYDWLLPTGGSFPNSPTLAVNITTNTQSSSAGNYTLVLTNQDNGCKSNSVIPMQQNLYAPTASISITSSNATITCLTPSIQLSNSSKTGIPPSAGFPTIGIIQVVLWEPPAGSPTPTLALVSSYSMATTPGLYTMTVRDLNNGCTSFTTIYLPDGRVYPVVNNPAVPAATLDCGGVGRTTAVTAVVSPSTGVNYSYLWTGPPGAVFTPTSLTAQTESVNTLGVYTVVVTNNSNGCSKDGTIAVVEGKLSADFTPDKTSGYAPLTVNFTNNSSSSSASAGTQSITSVWNFGNGKIDTTHVNKNSVASNGTTVYDKPGTYTVTLFTRKGNCSAKESVVITVDIKPELEKVPNIFTPNGDGVNDLFFLKVANLTEIHMTIYDRWGQVVYELDSNTGNVEWDGKTMYGKDAAAGTYFYILSAKGKDGSTEKDFQAKPKGTITLVR